jgi:hypothetical protein
MRGAVCQLKPHPSGDFADVWREGVVTDQILQLLSVLAQGIPQFGQDSLQLDCILCCDGLSTQFSDSSFQSYVIRHDIPPSVSMSDPRELFDTVHTVLPAPGPSR